MARLVGFTYRITVPAPPGMHDVVMAFELRGRDGQFGLDVVTEAPLQLQYLVGRSGEYVRGFCAGRGWTLEVLQVWDPPVVAEVAP